MDVNDTHLHPRFLLGLGLAIVAGFTLGACFDGLEAEGLPCETDAQCGPLLSCEDKYCGGVFACLDGAKIELDAVCDGSFDCADQSDEDPDACGFATPNQCEDEPARLIYLDGPRTIGASNPIKVVAENFVNDDNDDVLIAGEEGTFVKIVDFGTGPDSRTEYFLNGPPPSFGNRRVADFEVADLEGDQDLDIVIATDGDEAGDGFGVHVFRNEGGSAPTEFGSAASLPIDIEIRGIEIGRFDGDDWLDLVMVVDGPNTKGQIFTALGDPAASMGANYFSPEFSTLQLDYEAFFDSAAADVDGNGFDDLIVTGADASGPSLWLIKRNDGGVMAWQAAERSPTPGPAQDIAVGRLGGLADPQVGMVAIIDGDRLLAFRSDGNQLVPRMSAVTDFGGGLSGITLADVNCDNIPDWLVNVGNPAEIRVWIGDGEGDVLRDVDITIPSGGDPAGGLAVSQFDGDDTWDIVQALGDGGGQLDPEIRVWFTTDPMAGAP